LIEQPGHTGVPFAPEGGIFSVGKCYAFSWLLNHPCPQVGIDGYVAGGDRQGYFFPLPGIVFAYSLSRNAYIQQPRPGGGLCFPAERQAVKQRPATPARRQAIRFGRENAAGKEIILYFENKKQ
jgi:hypothetical protein